MKKYVPLHLRTPDYNSGKPSGGSGGQSEAFVPYEVNVFGESVPPPVSSFGAIFGQFWESQYQNLTPTSLQSRAILIAVAGRDMMACDHFGSGKIAAICLPIIYGVLSTKSASDGVGCPKAPILSPTRESATEIHKEAEKFAQSRATVAVVYDGVHMEQQISHLKDGVDILVATPNRLLHLIDVGALSLQSIEYLAIDEADRMLDMEFEPQMRDIVLQRNMPAAGTRKTFLFSATFPEKIESLANDFLIKNYILLTVEGRPIKRGPNPNLIAQKIEYVRTVEKSKRLHDLLKNQTGGKFSLTLVFVESQLVLVELQNKLLMQGFNISFVYDGQEKMEKDLALRKFKSGENPTLVAMESALGDAVINHPHIAHVINFDLPKTIEEYSRRIGHTGQAFKGSATAFFCIEDQSLAKELGDLMKKSNLKVPDFLIVDSDEQRRNSGARWGDGAEEKFRC